MLARIKHKQIATEYVHLPLRTMTGVGIDVFPLVGFPDSEKNRMIMLNFCKMGRYMERESYYSIWNRKILERRTFRDMS